MSIPIMSTVATCETVQDAHACLSNIFHINPLPASDNLQTVLIQIRMIRVVGKQLSLEGTYRVLSISRLCDAINIFASLLSKTRRLG